MKPGWILKKRQLLYALLLQSLRKFSLAFGQSSMNKSTVTSPTLVWINTDIPQVQ